MNNTLRNRLQKPAPLIYIHFSGNVVPKALTFTVESGCRKTGSGAETVYIV